MHGSIPLFFHKRFKESREKLHLAAQGSLMFHTYAECVSYLPCQVCFKMCFFSSHSPHPPPHPLSPIIPSPSLSFSLHPLNLLSLPSLSFALHPLNLISLYQTLSLSPLVSFPPGVLKGNKFSRLEREEDWEGEMLI